VAKTSEDVSLPDPTGKSFLRKSRRELRDSSTPVCRSPVIRRQNRLHRKTHFANRFKQMYPSVSGRLAG
jgi:hypothetical protein